MGYREKYESWLNDPCFDETTKAELRSIADDAKEDESVRLRRTRSAKEEEGQNESEEGSGNWEKEKLRKNEVEETHNSGSQKDPKERSKVGKNGGESE